MLVTIIICGLLSSERHEVVLLTAYEFGSFPGHTLSLCQDVSCEKWVSGLALLSQCARVLSGVSGLALLSQCGCVL